MDKEIGISHRSEQGLVVLLLFEWFDDSIIGSVTLEDGQIMRECLHKSRITRDLLFLQEALCRAAIAV
jgi:hypothetical protein